MHVETRNHRKYIFVNKGSDIKLILFVGDDPELINFWHRISEGEV